MNKKFLTSVLIGTMSLSALAGCSKADARTSAQDQTAGTVTETADESTEPSKSDLAIEKKIGDISKEDESKFRQGYLDFSLEVLKKCLNRDGKDSNVMVSPASIMLALDMTAAGATGDTLEQMMGLYGGIGDPQGQLSYAAKLLKRMNDVEGIKLHAADSIWVNKSIMPEGLKDDYADFVKKYFEAEVDSTVFDDAAKNRINDWVSDKTDKMIPTIVDDLDPQISMMLINAIVFDGKWAKQYEDYQVAEEDFTAASGEKQKVQMMTSGEDLYLENDLATGFIKYYEGGQYAFVVMLPKDKTKNAGDLIDGFTGESFDEYINSASQDYILTTKMPEFTSDWGGSIKEQLIALGMKAPFDRVAADFSGISECGEDLYIGDVIHKTHIEVDRNGTKAAATTAVVTYRNAAVVDQRERREVICDRPYAYAIVDTTDNTPVFIGTVNDVME